VSIGALGGGAIYLSWTFPIAPSSEVFTLFNVSGGGIIAIHTEVPALASGNFTFSGVTPGLAVRVSWVATATGYQDGSGLSNGVTVT
jgi:hypothetical protein